MRCKPPQKVSLRNTNRSSNLGRTWCKSSRPTRNSPTTQRAARARAAAARAPSRVRAAVVGFRCIRILSRIEWSRRRSVGSRCLALKNRGSIRMSCSRSARCPLRTKSRLNRTHCVHKSRRCTSKWACSLLFQPRRSKSPRLACLSDRTCTRTVRLLRTIPLAEEDCLSRRSRPDIGRARCKPHTPVTR